MALFGNLYNPSLGAKMRVPGLDETYAPIQAPSLDSLSGVTGNGSAALTAPMQAPKKPGAFTKDGIGWKILGIIGDSLATAGGGQGTYMPAMLDLQQQTAKERQFQEQLAAKQGAEWDMWQRQQQWKKDNPDPGDDAFTRAMAAAGIQMGTPEYMQMARKRADMLTNPVQLIPDGFGGATPARPNSMGSGFPQGYDPNEWEVVGGGASNGTGGFR